MYPYENFSEEIQVALSEAKDGSMKISGNGGSVIVENAAAFLQSIDMDIAASVCVRLDYTSDDFRKYSEVNKTHAGDGMTKPSGLTSDALFTCEKGLALFLPLADCVGAVLYDPLQKVLGVSHLGRHNLLQYGATSSVRFMVEKFDSDPRTIRVLLTAGAGAKNYPVYDFNNRALHEIAIEQLLQAGVGSGNILVDERDTTTDETLFSHSEFLKGHRQTDGRQAVVAMMRP